MKLIIFKNGDMSLRDNDNTLMHNGEDEISREIDLSSLTPEDISLVHLNLGDKVKINQILAKYNLSI